MSSVWKKRQKATDWEQKKGKCLKHDVISPEGCARVSAQELKKKFDVDKLEVCAGGGDKAG